MDANVGDEIVVRGRHTGEPDREGEILEILERNDVVYYRVRWDDGHEALFFPSSDAYVVHTARPR